ncbi:hypothetical protein EJF36_10330 [Bacillus sp. HMF5848]|uniref:hypothetical protein n=1 Tax=Bacillus sp. HMF5848 TaxID=2495421 RepID=UPI000F78E856|nr:hypothetical protein [Bacillus sp. HMF5848]RSK27245.1 hypothetical protein EJF36_10330 [Bacillus sp. HMF5848]
MSAITVYQVKDDSLNKIKQLFKSDEDFTKEILHTHFAVVLESSEVPVFADEEILLDSVEAMVNASQNKLHKFGAFDAVLISDKNKNTCILMLEDDEYELVELS